MVEPRGYLDNAIFSTILNKTCCRQVPLRERVCFEQIERNCPGAEDVCKTTVTREVYYSTDSIGNSVNTTVGEFHNL